MHLDTVFVTDLRQNRLLVLKNIIGNRYHISANNVHQKDSVEGGGREAQEGGDMCIPMADPC